MPRDPRVGCGTSLILFNADADGTSLILFNADADGIWLGLRSSPLETGKWGMPGGWLDYGEQPIQGVIRELKEETGIELDSTNVEEFAMFAHELPSIDCWCATLYFLAPWLPNSMPAPKVMEPDRMSEWRLFSKSELQGLSKEGKLMGSIPKALRRFYGAYGDEF
jgi:8-oxo-dGTP pyrophosphatase MutT (NUDIX family)